MGHQVNVSPEHLSITLWVDGAVLDGLAELIQRSSSTAFCNYLGLHNWGKTNRAYSAVHKLSDRGNVETYFLGLIKI